MTTTLLGTTGHKYGNKRDMPWHLMGKQLSVASTTNVEKAMAEAGLDFEVSLSPAYAAPSEFGNLLDAPNHRALTRPLLGEQRVLSFVGTRYTPIQNRDAFAVGNYLVSEFGAEVSGAADFRHGRASLMVFDLNRDLTVKRPDGQPDEGALYLVIQNTLDGSGALKFALTPMRFACTNALPMALAKAKRVWSVSHTPNAATRMSLAHDAILRAATYQEKFVAQAQAMADRAMTNAEFAKIVARIWPNPAKLTKDDGSTSADFERVQAIRSQVQTLFTASGTLEGLHNTQWGAYNAITEYLDWYRPVKEGARKGVAKGATQELLRAETAFEGRVVAAKERIQKMVSF